MNPPWVFHNDFPNPRMNSLISGIKPQSRMRSLLLIFQILLFIAISTVNFEYLVNRQSSTPLLILAILIELIAFYFLIYQPIKKRLL